MLNWFRFGNFISFIASSSRLAIDYRNNGRFRWLYVASLLNEKEGDTYDSSCKKSAKVLKRICKIDIWN